MSWLSKATGVHVNLKPLAPIIGGAVGSIIPGVGTALGAGLGSFLNGVGNGQGVGKSALSGLAAGAGGAALGGLGGLASKIPGVSALGSAASSVPGVQGVEQFLGGGQGGGGISGALGSVGNFLTGNGGKNALGLAEAANAAMLQSKQNDLAKGALGTAQQSYNERAPLRTAGVQGMLNPGAGIAPKIAALTANSSNPFQRPMPPSPAIQGVG